MLHANFNREQSQMNKKLKIFALAALLGTSVSSHATVVEFVTSQGTFQVNLFDETTPKTVENFLKYVNSERYNETVVHRLVKGFVMQGGGGTFDSALPLTPIETFPSVINEPVYSNVKGTIAMAKVDGNPNSATSQWFVNLADNGAGQATLDTQNGGFTVFGQVIGDGMEVVEKIAALDVCSGLPVYNFTQAQCADVVTLLGYENLVVVNSITVIDDNPASAANLNPIKNTAITQPTETNSSSGGSLAPWLLGLLAFVGIRRKR